MDKKNKIDQNLYEDHPFIHHKESPKSISGCLPLYLILCIIPILTLIILTKVKMPLEAQDSGEGNVYHRNSPFIYSNTRVESPLPLDLPNFADPFKTGASISNPSIQRELKFNTLPPQEPYHEKRGSAILNEEDLLTLPPYMQKDKSHSKTKHQQDQGAKS